jgi:RsiW-degrading membrane proteinase PrsW (M82 family)
MLVETANWGGRNRTSLATVELDPHSWRYLDGWQRAGDFGMIALDGETPIGAAWARPLSGPSAGYGYVSDEIPEITLAIDGRFRNLGLGRLLLLALTDKARELGVPRLSLSVEDGNLFARRLYERLGFAVVGRNGGSDTMLLTLSEMPTVPASARAIAFQPHKWLGPKGGWLVFLGLTVFWLANVLYDQLALHHVGLSPNSLVLGGFGMTAALVYTIAYRLRLSEGISVVRLLLAFILGGLLSTELAILIEGPLLSFAVAGNPNGELVIRSLAGVIEELCKIVTVVIFARGLTVKTAHSGLMLGGAVGLGFAAFEDMRYAAASIAQPALGLNPLGSVLSVTFGRDLFGPFEHPVLTSLLAAALFAATVNGRYRITLRVIGVYLGVAVAHGLVDSLPGLVALTGMTRLSAELLGGLLSIVVIAALDVIWLVYSRRLRKRVLEVDPPPAVEVAPG